MLHLRSNNRPCLGALLIVTALAWVPSTLGIEYDQLPDQSPPLERLINLNVVAIHSHGQPVTDLTGDDFQVSDGGRAQKVAFFRHDDSKLQQISPLGPHEYSNRAGANVPHATLILFDLLNEHFGARGNSWNELVHNLQPLESADYLYLYLLTVAGRLYPVHALPGA